MAGDDIFDPKFWSDRIKAAEGYPEHHSIYRCGDELWTDLENLHKRLLASYVPNDASILDAGCAWGRLLDLLPNTWDADYLGIDISPEFIKKAKQRYPVREFLLGDLRYIELSGTFDLAILISVRPMIARDMGFPAWKVVENNLRKYVDSILYLEYDLREPDDPEYYGGFE